MRSLSIAGVNFRLRCDAPLSVASPPEHYIEFTDRPASGKNAIDVTVAISGDPPRQPSRAAVFTAGDTWTLTRDKAGSCITYHGNEDNGLPLWTAHCNKDFRRIRVACNPSFRRSEAETQDLTYLVQYPLDQILLMNVLARNRGLIMHAAGAEIDGKGLLFPGYSGAGKSTLAQTLRRDMKIRLLSDDRIALRNTADGFHAWGTPWPGDERVALNRRAPLFALFFPARARQTTIHALEQQEVLTRLLPVVSIPWYDPELTSGLLDFLECVITGVPAYELAFNPEENVAEILLGRL